MGYSYVKNDLNELADWTLIWSDRQIICFDELCYHQRVSFFLEIVIYQLIYLLGSGDWDEPKCPLKSAILWRQNELI